MYIIRKVRGKELYSVKNVETGKIHSHATTKANAKKQVKLLLAIDHGFVPQSSKDLEGGCFGLSCFGRTNQVAPAREPIQDALYLGRPGSMRRGNIARREELINGRITRPSSPVENNDSRPPSSTGSGRMNPAVQSMITYLKSLYPHKTLISVANEILKLTGHKMTGRGRKSLTATEIAKYVIGAIGATLAIAVAIFLINNEIQEEKEYQKSVKQIEEDRKKYREEQMYNKQYFDNKKQVEDSRKRAADTIRNDLQKERELMDRINQQQEYEKNSISNDYRRIVDPISNPKGGARLSSVAQNMITYLKSLYPHKTLISVANEILKLTGHHRSAIENGVLKMTGKGRKSTSASTIAKYVIGAIGTALAIAVAVFLLSEEDKSISQPSIHPRLDKVGPEQIDTYPYPPKPSSKPVTPSVSAPKARQSPDISLENLYGEQALPSYTNMNNPGFGKVGRPKKKSEGYPIPSENFEGNPRGYGRRKRLRKTKSDSHLEGGMFSWLFGNRNRVAPTQDVRLRRILTNSTERNRARIAPIDTEAMPVLEGILPIGNVNIDNRRPGTPFDPNHTLPEGSIVRRGRGRKGKKNLRKKKV